jgi:acetyl-CoA synthetase
MAMPSPTHPKPETQNIASLLKEGRTFPPSPEFVANARVQGMEGYKALYEEAKSNPDAFWAKQAEELQWIKPFEKVLTWNEPHARWFEGGTLNASINCVDRHLKGPNRNKAAIIWEGEPGDSRVLTYQMLHREVCQFANGLKLLGMKSGDRATIYMPLIPEAVVAMLACARLGIVHSVVFGGFSAEAVAERTKDAGATLVITADGGYRRGKSIPLKANVDDALNRCPDVAKCVVYKRTGEPVQMKPSRDIWWHDLVQGVEAHCEPAAMQSEDPLFILYTSGSTGKPKGILHTTAGYLLGASYSHRMVFDLRDDDVYWCTADIGWITGHSYVVYGPLCNGSTLMLYEGAPDFPAKDRFWEIIAKYGVSVFYTAPTAIRAFIKWGDELPAKHDLSSLRLLGTVGEPINPEAWIWFHEKIGKGRCPIVDTWWQTETGAIMIAPLPGAVPTKPGSATLPLPGIIAEVVDKKGNPVGDNEGGYLVISRPWPSMLRTIFNDDARYRSAYWETVPNVYFTADGARRDQDGYLWIMGRVDDVLNVAGHRLSTMEVESALVNHPSVAEAAAVGRPDEIKGEGIVVFVTLKQGKIADDKLKQALREHVSKEIGALARPDEIRFAESLPKTRSGKIMRRLLRDIASGNQTTGDTTTLEDLSVLAKLRDDEE